MAENKFYLKFYILHFKIPDILEIMYLLLFTIIRLH